MNKKMYKGDKVKRFLVHIPMYMLSLHLPWDVGECPTMVTKKKKNS